MGAGCPCPRGRSLCWAALWPARMPLSPMMKQATPSLGRIIHPTCICRRSSSSTASKVVEAIGTALFVIDRAANSVALARAFETQGWGWLSMLDDNEQQGLASFEATEVSTLT